MYCATSKINRLTLLLLAAIVFLSACDKKPDTYQAKFMAFTTEVDVSMYGVDEATAKRTIEALKHTFSKVNKTWHAWHPSVLTRINQAIHAGQPITVYDDVAHLIRLGQTLAQQSHDLFNPAAGQLFALWGFHRDDWFQPHPPPSQDQIKQWLNSHPTMADIHIDKGILTSTNNDVELGFGGFAKGYAVDAAMAVLKQEGIKNAIINIGGDLRVIGSHGARPWMIGIRHPRQKGVLATVAVQGGESVFTSGDYERFFEYQGKRYSHIIDPRTGYPAQGATSVTVIHTNASIADAAATALFVAGPDWPEIAESMGIQFVMLVRSDGQIEMSPAMAARIQLNDKTRPVLVRDIK